MAIERDNTCLYELNFCLKERLRGKVCFWQHSPFYFLLWVERAWPLDRGRWMWGHLVLDFPTSTESKQTALTMRGGVPAFMGQRQAGFCEFKASIVYIESFQPARTPQWDTVSKKKKRNIQKKFTCFPVQIAQGLVSYSSSKCLKEDIYPGWEHTPYTPRAQVHNDAVHQCSVREGVVLVLVVMMLLRLLWVSSIQCCWYTGFIINCIHLMRSSSIRLHWLLCFWNSFLSWLL